MRPFRFRAQAALQLRRREHDRALVDLAHAQAALVAARQDVEDADRALHDADDQQRIVMARAETLPPLEWYRSWRLRLIGNRRRCEEQRTAREADVATAAAAEHRARVRVRSLERLQDLARAEWQRAADREERIAMDALAAARYVRQKEESLR